MKRGKRTQGRRGEGRDGGRGEEAGEKGRARGEKREVPQLDGDRGCGRRRPARARSRGREQEVATIQETGGRRERGRVQEGAEVVIRVTDLSTVREGEEEGRERPSAPPWEGGRGLGQEGGEVMLRVGEGGREGRMRASI